MYYYQPNYIKQGEKLFLHKPRSLFGFIVYFCDDSIFLVHEVIVNFLQFTVIVEETLELRQSQQNNFA